MKVSLPLNKQDETSPMLLNFTFQLGYPAIPISIELCSNDASGGDALEEERAFLLSIQNDGIQDCCDVVRRFKERFLLSKADVQLPTLNETELETHIEEEDRLQDLPEGPSEPSVAKAPHCTYCCKVCATVLFESSQLHEHSVPKPGVHNHRCTSYYLEDAPAWLSTESNESDKLHCTKCKARVGTWSWAGGKCSCEAWITPAFQFVKSKLDEKFT